MSASNVLNINEQIAVIILSANVASFVDLPYTPEFIELTNSGTGTAYAKAISPTGTPMTVPASNFPAVPATQNGVEVQPGASKTYRHAYPNAGVPMNRISMISPAGTTISIKIGRGI